jgi:hypothetical protein
MNRLSGCHARRLALTGRMHAIDDRPSTQTSSPFEAAFAVAEATRAALRIVKIDPRPAHTSAHPVGGQLLVLAARVDEDAEKEGGLRPAHRCRRPPSSNGEHSYAGDDRPLP